MTTMKLPEWMADLCSGWAKNIQKPTGVVIAGQPYALATNGHGALLLAGDYGLPEATVAGSITGMVKTMPEPSGALSLADLRAFLGSAASPPVATCVHCEGTGEMVCPTCEGSGEVECECECGHEHEADCEDCDGSSIVPCVCMGNRKAEHDPFVLGGMVFDKNLVARYIRHLPDGEATAHIARFDGPMAAKPSFLCGDGWILLLMPLRREGTTTTPTFPLAQEVHSA